MDASYNVEIDTAGNLLVVTMLGFFSTRDIIALRKELSEAIAAFSCMRGQHLALYDIRECKIQSQEVVQILRSMSDRKGVAARRIAIVTGSSLMRMQLPRIVVDRESQWFDEATSARKWLFLETAGSPAVASIRTRV